MQLCKHDEKPVRRLRLSTLVSLGLKVSPLSVVEVNSPMTTPLSFFLTLCSFASTLFVVWQLVLRYLYDVKLGTAAVEIVVFKRFVIFSIPYEEVATLQRISFVEAIFSFAFGLVNRPFGGYVLLHRNRGLFRKILVTPGRSDEFCSALLRKCGVC